MMHSLLPSGRAPEPADWTIVHRSDPAMDVHLKLLAEQAEEALRAIRAAEATGQPARPAVPERPVPRPAAAKRKRWLAIAWRRMRVADAAQSRPTDPAPLSRRAPGDG